MFDKYLDKNLNKMIDEISNLISFKSISDEDSTDNAHPFGKECTKALEYTLNLASQMGFKVKNIDNKLLYYKDWVEVHTWMHTLFLK